MNIFSFKNPLYSLLIVAALFVSVQAFGANPSVSIKTPGSTSAFITGTSILITGKASDSDIGGSITKVEVFLGANKLGDATYDTGLKLYKYNWASPAAGSYVIQLKATDNTSSTALSSQVSVTVHPTSIVSNKKYYVKQGASTSNSGLSPTTPFPTIGKAAALTNPGDTVFVMGGTYASFGIKRTGTAAHWIVYINYQGQTPLIQYGVSWAGISISDGGSYIVIDGFKIQGNNDNVNLTDAQNQPGSCIGPNPTGSPDGKFNGSGISLEGRAGSSAAHVHHISILRCEIFDGGTAGVAGLEADYVTVQKCKVYDNSWYTIYGGSGISLLHSWNFDSNTGYRNVIKDNIVYGNKLLVPWSAPGVCKITDGNGIIIDSNQNKDVSGLTPYTGRTLVANNLTVNNGGSGIHSFQSDHVDIINNTSYHNSLSTNPSGELYGVYGSDMNILNNIVVPITNEPANSNSQITATVIYDYNLYFNTTNIKVKGAHDVIGDPKFAKAFVDGNTPVVENFKLLSSSPAINKGTLSKAPTNDYFGFPRPSQSVVDVGFYEFQGPVNITVTGVAVSPTVSTLAINGTQQLTATVAPENATNKTVSWSSGNTTVATVSTTGLVTAKAAGTAAITVTTQDGSKTATATITVTSPNRTPENPSNVVSGLAYSYYENTSTTFWNLIPDFSTLTVTQSGYTPNVSLTAAPATRADNYAYKFTGYIIVPTNGTYTFYTNSDDGSRLYIGTTLVVDNDGAHGALEKSGSIGLNAGKHAITITYYEGGVNNTLVVSYEGPGITKTITPASAFYRPKGTVSLLLEAEDAVKSGVVSSTLHTGYTGTGFGDYINASADYIEWTANIPTADSYVLNFRYGLETSADRPLEIKVNGVVVAASLSFPNTTVWTNWSTVSINTNLNQGVNTIRATAIGSSGPNIDNLTIQSGGIVARYEISEVASFEGDYINMYPNPTTGLVTLKADSNSKILSVQVFNPQGKTILTKSVDQLIATEIDLSQQPSDVYIFKIKHQHGVSTKKVVLVK